MKRPLGRCGVYRARHFNIDCTLFSIVGISLEMGCTTARPYKVFKKMSSLRRGCPGRSSSTGLRSAIFTMVRWVSTVVEGGAPYKRGSEGPRNRNDTGRDEGNGQAGNNTRRKRDTVRSRAKQLPHDDPAHIAKLQSRRHSATPELAALRRYTLANRGAYDLTTLSTLYAAAGMLKYASATLDQVYADKNAARPTALQWIELLEAGRQARDPIFAREMMNGIRGRDGRNPSKKMQQVLLNTYAESGMAREALQLYKEMAARHDADVSMAIAVLKGCIRRRDLPESFVDGVIDVIQEGNRPLPRRVKSMVLMVRIGPLECSRFLTYSSRSSVLCFLNLSGICIKGHGYG